MYKAIEKKVSEQILHFHFRLVPIYLPPLQGRVRHKVDFRELHNEGA